MRKYNVSYQRTHDIDWFVRHDGKVYHFASNGGLLPDFIKCSQNRIVQHLIAKKEDKKGIDINIHRENISDYFYIEEIGQLNEFLLSFIEMARKGIISCDNVSDNPDSPIYRIIAESYSDMNSSFGDSDILELIPEFDVGQLIWDNRSKEYGIAA